MRNHLKTLTPVLAALTLTATISTSALAMPNMAAAPATAPAPATATQTTAISGKVAETFNSGGYTYVAVEKEGQRTWIASTPVTVTLGQKVSFKTGLVMHNFTSNSLKRTFETIVFSDGLVTPADK